MKSDHWLYTFFSCFKETYFELQGLPGELAERYEFKAEELKDSAPRLDGVFIPKNPADPVYFLEAQFYKDPKFYPGLFQKVFLYLKLNDPNQDFHVLILYGTRSHEADEIGPYKVMLESRHVTRIYLDEVSDSQANLGIAMLHLLGEKKSQVLKKAKELIARTQKEKPEEFQKQALSLIEKLLISKFPDKKVKEIEAMLELDDLRDTVFYKEAAQDGAMQEKLKLIPRLAAKKWTPAEIAETLELPKEVVEKELQLQAKKN